MYMRKVADLKKNGQAPTGRLSLSAVSDEDSQNEVSEWSEVVKKTGK